ncbi:hypothetical protein [Amycolatopsis sp. WAC 01416]|uniref:hypothetical protein n=1 Tax=Amycolatopsis sp. WAC 01416 TaxID=2203196 RepID=UPI0018F560C1|nr:hypothetical protein [Amycolatopsis sp. WAC 01416]
MLGFKAREDVGFAGMRWVSVSPPSQPDLRIALAPPDLDQGASPADRQAIEDLMAKGLLGRLVFVTLRFTQPELGRRNDHKPSDRSGLDFYRRRQHDARNSSRNQ